MSLKDLKRNIKYADFRLRIRSALKQNDKEQLSIILQETKREIEIRNKKERKWKK